MINKVMIDSFLLVEYYKGSKIKLLVDLIRDINIECCINETVVSKFLFHLLKLNVNKSPQSVQSSRNVGSELRKFDASNFLQRLSFLKSDDTLYSLVPQLMSAYNLLPNDSIILATCKIHNITKLASHDADFIVPCQQEGIQLLTETK